MSESLLSVIARIRRAMPRNADVMLVCDEAERLMINSSREAKPLGSVSVSFAGPIKAPFNKKAYQRKYMADRRKGGK